MEKTLRTFFVASILLMLGFGQAQAQEDYVTAGFSLGSGVTAWTAVSGAGGFGQMNFGHPDMPLVNSSASNQFGSVSVFARPWATGQAWSDIGGSASVSASFVGNGEAGVQFVKEKGVNTFTSITKSMSLTATSHGTGSASAIGGFDVDVRASGFIPVPTVPVFEVPPSPSAIPGGKG